MYLKIASWSNLIIQLAKNNPYLILFNDPKIKARFQDKTNLATKPDSLRNKTLTLSIETRQSQVQKLQTSFYSAPSLLLDFFCSSKCFHLVKSLPSKSETWCICHCFRYSLYHSLFFICHFFISSVHFFLKYHLTSKLSECTYYESRPCEYHHIH